MPKKTHRQEVFKLSELFRKKALERLSSPEQLDSLLQITSPCGWVWLMATGLCLVTALLWGIYGSVSFEISGQGLLMNEKGIFTVQAQGQGFIETIYVQNQDMVTKGQIIATLLQPDLVSQLEGMEKNHSDFVQKLQFRKTSGFQENQQKLAEFERKKRTLTFGNQSYVKRISRLEKKIKDQDSLYKQGLITHDTLFKTMNDLDDSKTKLMSDKEEFKKIEAEIIAVNNPIKLELLDLQRQIDSIAEDIKAQKIKIKETSQIKTPYTGIVVGLDIKKGAMIQQGSGILTVKVADNTPFSLKLISFFPAEKGEKIIQGMTMQISPGNIDTSRYGYALGVVNYVSEFPASSDEMNLVLQNDEMVRDLLSRGPLIEVHSVLTEDTGTPSGFKWTSAQGPPTKIHPGTYSYGSVIVDKSSPISLVLPLLRKYVFGSAPLQSN